MYLFQFETTLGIVLDALQIGNQRVDNHVELGGGDDIILIVGDTRLCGVGHIAERTDQIEIAEGTDGLHLGNRRLQLIMRVVRVYLLNFRSIVTDDVTAVDDIVYRRPFTHVVGGQQVLPQHLVEVIGNVCASHYVVGAQLSPDAHAGDYVFACQGFITAVDGTCHIGLLLPVVLQHRRVHGQDVEEITAAHEEARGER